MSGPPASARLETRATGPQTALVFLATLAVYVASPVHVQADSHWSIPTAISLLRTGTITLDGYQSAVERLPHGTVRVGAHVYPWYPLAVPLLALPVVAAMEGGARLLLALPHPPAFAVLWDARFRNQGDVVFGYYGRTEGFIASLYTALAVALFWTAARRRADTVPALSVTVLLAFGTGLFSTASRVLWQHGPSAAVLAAVVCLLTREKEGWRWPVALGLAAGLAYAVRPTNSLTALGLLVYVALRRPRALPLFALGAAAVAVPFCTLNLAFYGALLPPYFRVGLLAGDHRHFWGALAGNLVSPNRGLFVWTPLALLGLGSALYRLLHRRLGPPETWMLVVVLLHWLVVSLLPQWWGGHSVGPRFFSDLSPYLFWLLVEPVQRAFQLGREGHPASLVVLFGLGLLGVFAHARGATNTAVHRWNDGPPGVDAAPQRVWDWSDVQFLRGLAAPARPGPGAPG